jgi:hypothetical protein
MNGNQLSPQGYPITPWARNNQNNIDSRRDSRPMNPPRTSRQGGNDGRDDYGDDDDDDDGANDDYRNGHRGDSSRNRRGDDDSRGGRRFDNSREDRRSSHGNFTGGRGPGRQRLDRDAWEASRPNSPSPTSFLNLDPNQEIALRIQQTSIMLHYPAPPADATGDEIMSNCVAWLSNSIDGPYAGKLERLTKCAFQLPNDSPSAFFIFYASLQAFLTSCGFNEELLPTLQFIKHKTQKISSLTATAHRSFYVA